MITAWFTFLASPRYLPHDELSGGQTVRTLIAVEQVMRVKPGDP